MTTEEVIGIVEIGVLAALAIWLAKQLPNFPNAIASYAAAQLTYAGSGYDAALNLQQVKEALQKIDNLPAWLPIPATGLTAGELYAAGFSTEEIKAKILYYATNYAADQIGQLRLAYQLGSIAGTFIATSSAAGDDPFAVIAAGG